MSRPCILFAAGTPTTFVRDDLALLEAQLREWEQTQRSEATLETYRVGRTRAGAFRKLEEIKVMAAELQKERGAEDEGREKEMEGDNGEGSSDEDER